MVPECHGQPFLKPEDYSESKGSSSDVEDLDKQADGPLVKRWRSGAKAEEKKGHYPYIVTRSETDKRAWDSINTLHGESFIAAIEALLKTKNHVKVLDVGGGPGVYAEQLRKKFGDRITVYTTGLSKKAARTFRNDYPDTNEPKTTHPPDFALADKLHPDDLKWRSILQLSNSPEFDLIIDTYGESVDQDFADQPRYLATVIAKLLPGGRASIFPFDFNGEWFEDFQKQLHDVAVLKKDGATLKITKL